MAGQLGRSAVEIAAAVRESAVTAREVVEEHLQFIATTDPHVGAFRRVRAERARAEADAVDSRPDRYALPLAGVPVAIKDTIAVAGECVLEGSRSTSRAVAAKDHEVVRRLRHAGAVVIGLTRVPELAVFSTTEDADGIARNPWDLTGTPGGSSGGSAAAIAAGMVPIAHGSDGLGSIRIPAACCGLVGLKPGRGVVPANLGAQDWSGLAENGVLATSVEDAETMLRVIAGQAVERRPAPGPMRIAVSWRSPIFGVRPDPYVRRVLTLAVRALIAAGNSARLTDPPYPVSLSKAAATHWLTCATAIADERGLALAALQPRTRRHVELGRAMKRLGLHRPATLDGWRSRMEAFFGDHDVLVTPVLATAPPRADGWAKRSWRQNALTAVRYAPYPAVWNLAGYPAMAVPVGGRPGWVPASVQLVAAPGGESLLLAAARQLESRAPWPRHAPGWLQIHVRQPQYA